MYHLAARTGMTGTWGAKRCAMLAEQSGCCGRAGKTRAAESQAFGSPGRLRYNRFRRRGVMSEVEQIEQQIEGLDDRAFARFREWFIEYDHARWDRQIEADSAAGKLDALAEKALAEHRAGKTRRL